MKKILLVAALVGVASAGVYWIYQVNQKPPVDPWQLVPRQAFLVYEGASSARFDSIISTNQNRELLRLAATSPTNAHLHAFQQSGVNTESIVIFQLGELQSDSTRARFSLGKKRIYEGFDIYTVKMPKGEFVFCEVENYGLLSTNSLLVEGAIRQYKGQVLSFREDNLWLFSVPALKKDAGNVYVNWPGLYGALEKNQPGGVQLSLLQNIAGTSVFDVKLSPRSVLFSGFGTDSIFKQPSILSLFKRQEPVSLRLLDEIPDQFDLVTHFGVSDASTFYEDRQRMAESDTAWQRIAKSFSQHSIEVKNFWNEVDHELVRLQDQNREVVFIRIHQITKMQAFLKQLQGHPQLSSKHNTEQYSTSTIHTFVKSELGYYLLWPLIRRKDQIHMALVNDILVASPDEKFLKEIISSLDSENTLGKSLVWRAFLDNTQSESNLTLLFSTPSARSDADAGTSALLGRLLQANRGSIQFTRIDQHFYASSFFSLDGRKADRPSISGTSGVPAPKSNLYPVVNFTNENNEVIFQNESGKLNLWNGTKITWSIPIEGELLAVHQVDYLKNRKLQYLCATPSRLYLIDRLGKAVEGFPVNFPAADIKYLEVVDYNNTKDYRFIAARENGEIWLLDRKGKALPGWNPKRSGIKLASSPDFYRLKQRDFFAAVDVAGVVHAFNRRAEVQAGFPFETRALIGGALTKEDDHFLFVTQDGRLVKLNGQGKVNFEEVLVKNDNSARFAMLKERTSYNSLVARIERGKIAIFNTHGKQLFEISNPLSDGVVLSYHTFARGRDVVLVYDRDQQLFFAVDKAGKMLVPQPLESLRHPAVGYDKKRQVLKIAYYAGNELLSIDVPF